MNLPGYNCYPATIYIHTDLWWTLAQGDGRFLCKSSIRWPTSSLLNCKRYHFLVEKYKPETRIQNIASILMLTLHRWRNWIYIHIGEKRDAPEGNKHPSKQRWQGFIFTGWTRWWDAIVIVSFRSTALSSSISNNKQTIVVTKLMKFPVRIACRQSFANPKPRAITRSWPNMLQPKKEFS